MKVLCRLEDFIGCDRVFVYGCGSTGRELRQHLSESGISCCFIDSFRAGTADGVPVLLFDHYLKSRQTHDVIIVASEWRSEIAKNLESVGISNYYCVSRINSLDER